MVQLVQKLPVDPASDWEIVAAELCAVREQIKQLQHREDDLVTVFRGFGAGVYAGKQHTITVVDQERRTVDVDGLRSKYPGAVEEFTRYKHYLIVRAARIGLVVLPEQQQHNEQSWRW